MDERQQQIREGAGLTESKLNVEFIDFLKRWSTPMLLVVAAAALGYFLYQRYERAQAEQVNAAFREFETAAGSQNPNPETLKAIAEQYSGVRGVGALARLRAADEYLKAIRVGYRLGAQPKPDGTFAAEDVLTEQDRAKYLSDAEALYQAVLDATAPDEAKTVHAVQAAFGVAAVAESRGEVDKARAAYERVVQLSDRAGYTGQAEFAKRRIESLPRLAQAPKLYSEAELPKPPEAPKPATESVPELKAPALEFKPAAPATTPPSAPASGSPAPASAAPASAAPASAAPASAAPASTPPASSPAPATPPK